MDRSIAKYVVAASLALSLAAAPAVFAADKVKAITFEDLVFEMVKGGVFKRSMLTPEIEALDGKRVSIKGYMRPSFQQDGIKNFIFVRDNLECCYGPGAALFDCAFVYMQGNATASFSVRPMTVEGVFRIDEYLGPDGVHLAIFRIDADKAK